MNSEGGEADRKNTIYLSETDAMVIVQLLKEARPKEGYVAPEIDATPSEILSILLFRSDRVIEEIDMWSVFNILILSQTEQNALRDIVDKYAPEWWVFGCSAELD